MFHGTIVNDLPIGYLRIQHEDVKARLVHVLWMPRGVTNSPVHSMVVSQSKFLFEDPLRIPKQCLIDFLEVLVHVHGWHF